MLVGGKIGFSDANRIDFGAEFFRYESHGTQQDQSECPLS